MFWNMLDIERFHEYYFYLSTKIGRKMNHSQVYKNGQSFEEKKAAITSMLKERTVSSEDVCRFLSQIMKDNSVRSSIKIV